MDYAYTLDDRPKIAVEVLLGHGVCSCIIESSVIIPKSVVKRIVERISGLKLRIRYTLVPQDTRLANNQYDKMRCGDNGIFKGAPITIEQRKLTKIAKELNDKFKCDGKYILDKGKLIICQSNCANLDTYPNAIVNPIGYWTGGIGVDSGATNRKLGSDMGDSITGGGLHGKDLSKADVSINIYCFLKAQELGNPYKLSCAIGDEFVDGLPYSKIVEIAKEYIDKIGGFEKFAEWGLIR